MININRRQPSTDLSNLLAAKISDSEWIGIDASDTKAMRHYFDRDSRLKKLVREELFEAQHGLCAYCMAEISLDPSDEEKKNKSTKIEHYTPLSADKNGVFDFNNFFLVCTGGDDDGYSKSKLALSCDSKKGEKSISIDPTNADHISHLQYQDDGIILFCDKTNKQLTSTIKDDLNIRLGLNGTFYQKGNCNKYDTRTCLVERRKQVFSQAFGVIKRMKEKHIYTKERLEKLISKEEASPHEFSGVYLFVYRRELNKSVLQLSSQSDI